MRDMTDDEFTEWLDDAMAEARHINNVFGRFADYAASLPGRRWVVSGEGLWKSMPR